MSFVPLTQTVQKRWAWIWMPIVWCVCCSLRQAWVMCGKHNSGFHSGVFVQWGWSSAPTKHETYSRLGSVGMLAPFYAIFPIMGSDREHVQEEKCEEMCLWWYLSADCVQSS